MYYAYKRLNIKYIELSQTVLDPLELFVGSR